MRTLLAESCPPRFSEQAIPARPQIGIFGTGSICWRAFEAIARSGAAEIAAIAQFASREVSEMARICSDAAVLTSLDDFLEVGVDGVVIATPGMSHAEQAIAALRRGVAVFCTHAPGRTTGEIRRVIHTARLADVLLDIAAPFTATESKLHDIGVTAIQWVRRLAISSRFDPAIESVVPPEPAAGQKRIEPITL